MKAHFDKSDDLLAIMNVSLQSTANSIYQYR